MKSIVNKREQRRNKSAEDICREVRFQLANYGGISDNERLFHFLQYWITDAKKNKYSRPKYNKKTKNVNYK